MAAEPCRQGLGGRHGAASAPRSLWGTAGQAVALASGATSPARISRQRKCQVLTFRCDGTQVRVRLGRGLAAALIVAIRVYQLTLSPLFAGACRFEPSCSCYATEAVQVHGPLGGIALTLRRLLRCHPFRGGGYDPVPPSSRLSSPISPTRPSVRAHSGPGASHSG